MKDMTYLGTGEAAKLAGVSARTVMVWCDSGLVKHWRVPGKQNARRIKRSDMIGFLRAHGVPIDRDTRHAVVTIGVGEALSGRIGDALSPDVYCVEHCRSTFEAGLIVERTRPVVALIDLSLGSADARIVATILVEQYGTRVLYLAGEDGVGILGLPPESVLQLPVDPATIVAKIVEGVT